MSGGDGDTDAVERTQDWRMLDKREVLPVQEPAAVIH